MRPGGFCRPGEFLQRLVMPSESGLFWSMPSQGSLLNSTDNLGRALIAPLDKQSQ